jgi:hypothetical protein
MAPSDAHRRTEPFLSALPDLSGRLKAMTDGGTQRATPGQGQAHGAARQIDLGIPTVRIAKRAGHRHRCRQPVVRHRPLPQFHPVAQQRPASHIAVHRTRPLSRHLVEPADLYALTQPQIRVLFQFDDIEHRMRGIGAIGSGSKTSDAPAPNSTCQCADE